MTGTVSSRNLLWIVLGLAVVALAVWLVLRKPVTPADERVYRIGYQQTSLYRHVFTAAEMGYFDDEGIQVELVPFASANQMMTALISGDIVATGLTNLEVAMRIEAEDPDQFEFANFVIWQDGAFPDYLLDCTPDRGLNSVTQLTGRRLGRHPGSAVGGFSRAVLQRYQIPADRVTVIELEPSLMRDAVVGRQVDAIYAMDPTATLLVRDNLCDVLLPNPLGQVVESPIPISGTALSRRLLTEQPAAAASIVRALNRGIEYSRNRANDAQVASYISEFTSIDPDVARNLNRTDYWTLAEVDRAQVQALADRFVELEIVDTRVETANIILDRSALDR